jgi:short-subunit dehydrogenase
MTRAFLPLLHRSEDACIVNLSSLYGLIAPPGQTAYSAAKFAVRGFSQSLRHELEGTRIGVLVVHPGGVATAIADNARVAQGVSREEIEARRAETKKLLTMLPAKAGEIIVRAIEKRKSRVIVGNDAKLVSLIERALPVAYWSVIERLRSRS